MSTPGGSRSDRIAWGDVNVMVSGGRLHGLQMQKERKVMEHKMRKKERKSTSIMMKLIPVRKVCCSTYISISIAAIRNSQSIADKALSTG